MLSFTQSTFSPCFFGENKVDSHNACTMQKVLALRPRAEYTVHNFIYTWGARYIVTGLIFHVCHGILWHVSHLPTTPNPQGTTPKTNKFSSKNKDKNKHSQQKALKDNILKCSVMAHLEIGHPTRAPLIFYCYRWLHLISSVNGRWRVKCWLSVRKKKKSNGNPQFAVSV